MISFVDWKLKGTAEFRQYDNFTSSLDIYGEIPEGWTYQLYISCKGNLNIVNLTNENNTHLYALFTADMLSINGLYYFQVKASMLERTETKVKHTNIISAVVNKSLSGDSKWPVLPTEFTDYENTIKELVLDAELAIEKVPYIGDNTNWYVWDPKTKSFVDTGVSAAGSGSGGTVYMRVSGGYIQYSNDNKTWIDLISVDSLKGQDGYSPFASVTETDDGAEITITDKTGTTTATVKNGKNGATGAPGKDGVTPNIQIGAVTTLDAGSDATASMTGTAAEPLLNLGIPKGADGESETWELLSDTTLDEDVNYIKLTIPPCKKIRAYFEGHQVFSDGSETSNNFTTLTPSFTVDGVAVIYPFYVLNLASRFNSDIVSVINFDISTPPFATGSLFRVFPSGRNTVQNYTYAQEEIAITEASVITGIRIAPHYKYVSGQGDIGRLASGGRFWVYGVKS